MYNWHAGYKNNLRTTGAQIVQKHKNNEARPTFTGSYKKKKRVLQVWAREDEYGAADSPDFKNRQEIKCDFARKTNIILYFCSFFVKNRGTLHC